MKRLICVTGGIGSGKSVVCRICSLRGVPVYDCDSRAKRIMHGSEFIRKALFDLIGESVIAPDGSIDRTVLSGAMFGSDDVRLAVNGIVHEAVRRDVGDWAASLPDGAAIVETAIPVTAGMLSALDEIWLVEAPAELRLQRVMKRSALSAAQVMARIRTQDEEYASLPAHKLKIINNDGIMPLLPQIPALKCYI